VTTYGATSFQNGSFTAYVVRSVIPIAVCLLITSKCVVTKSCHDGFILQLDINYVWMENADLINLSVKTKVIPLKKTQPARRRLQMMLIIHYTHCCVKDQEVRT
jgi:hypothetical protein